MGVVYESAFYVFGGYDGSARLNDFLMFRLDQCNEALAPTLVATTTAITDDSRSNVNECMYVCAVDFGSPKAGQYEQLQ